MAAKTISRKETLGYFKGKSSGNFSTHFVRMSNEPIPLDKTDVTS